MCLGTMCMKIEGGRRLLEEIDHFGHLRNRPLLRPSSTWMTTAFQERFCLIEETLHGRHGSIEPFKAGPDSRASNKVHP